MSEEHELEETFSLADRRAEYGSSKDNVILSAAFPQAKPIRLGTTPIKVTRPLYYRAVTELDIHSAVPRAENYPNAEAWVSARDLYFERLRAPGGAFVAVVDADSTAAIPRTGTCPNCKIGNVSRNFNMCGLLDLCRKQKCQVYGHVITNQE